MAVAQETAPGKKRETLASALLQVGAVALVLAAVVFVVYQRGTTRKVTAERTREAKGIALRGNPKDLDKALAELEVLFQFNAKAADGLAAAADIYAEQWLVHRVPGAEAKSREYLAKAESAGSKSEERFATRALHLVAAGKPLEAIAFVEELRKKGASSARLWHAIGKANQQLGNLTLAKQSFAQAADKAWKDPRFTTAFGEALIDEGLYGQAIEILSKGLTNANADHLLTRVDLALARALRKDKLKEALDHLTAVLGRDAELTPGLRARALAAKAHLALAESRVDEALSDADQAIAQNPNEHYALFARARALASQKSPAAKEAVTAAIAKRPTAPILYFEGASSLQAEGNHEAAMAVLTSYERAFQGVMVQTADNKSVSALSRDDRYWLTRGDVLKEAGKLDDALVAYDKAVAAENVNLAKAHLARATVFLAKNDYERAAEVLTDLTPPDGSGTFADAYLAMGDSLFGKKEFAPGCQNYAFALAKLKTQAAPREKLTGILETVNKRLIAAGQKPMAKLWMEEARPLIQ